MSLREYNVILWGSGPGIDWIRSFGIYHPQVTGVISSPSEANLLVIQGLPSLKSKAFLELIYNQMRDQSKRVIFLSRGISSTGANHGDYNQSSLEQLGFNIDVMVSRNDLDEVSWNEVLQKVESK
jgi:hypothetical protein